MIEFLITLLSLNIIGYTVIHRLYSYNSHYIVIIQLQFLAIQNFEFTHTSACA